MNQSRFNVKTLLFASLVVPVQQIQSWKVETYSKIPAHVVSASPEGLLVKVQKSASPLIHPLLQKERISGFQISGDFRGLPKFDDIKKQGDQKNDDYPLRFGLIVPGTKKLTGIKKFFAPKWVQQLYSQVPSELGLDRIQFFNITQSESQLGTRRIHPLSDLIEEEFVQLVKKPGPFEFSYKIQPPLDALGIWLSLDGDDTQSTYEVLIQKIELMQTVQAKK